MSFKGKQGSSQLTQVTQSRIESIKESTKKGVASMGKKMSDAKDYTKGKVEYMGKKISDAKNVASKTVSDARTAAGTAASSVASRTTQAMLATRNTASAINKRLDNTNKSNFVLPSSRGGALINKINLTDANNKSMKLDINNMVDLKSLVIYLRSKYSTDIDSIVIITYSPMGKNICNNKITFTEKELADVEGGLNVRLPGIGGIPSEVVLPEALSESP